MPRPPCRCVALTKLRNNVAMLNPDAPKVIGKALRTEHVRHSSIPHGLIAVVQLAEYLIQQHTDHNHTQEWPKLGAACLAMLGLSDDDLLSLVTESGPVTQDNG